MTTTLTRPTVEDVWMWLREVPDPEIPVISVTDTLAVTGTAAALGRVRERLNPREYRRFAQRSGYKLATERSHACSFSPTLIGSCRCTSDSGKTIFTSLIAIMGRKRMKRRKSEVKIPSVPMKVQMSTQVA